VKGILDNGSSTEFSRTGRFNVKIEDPNYIELIDPPDDSIPEIKETGVDFRWKGYSRAPEYLLEISSKEDMSKIMKKNYTKFSSYSERNFGSGKFFWRITLISREGKEISKSKIFSFKIPESEPLEPDFKPRIKDHPDTFYVDK
jgi:hypothetical protein